MKKIYLLTLTIMTLSLSAQQREKIKGSKIVTTEQKEIGDFDNLEVGDNLEIFLIAGTECGVEIEADDNLHDAISIDLHGGMLQLAAAKDVSGAKKFSVRITYTNDFKMVTAKGQSNVTALSDMTLDSFTFKTFDSAKVFATVKSKDFILSANDKSKTELNLTSEQSTVELSKNAQLKALISTVQMRFDMYQKSTASIEGDVTDLKLRLDNNANFTGKGLTAKTAALVIESYANCSLLVNSKIAIEASGKSEIQLYGDPQIEVKKFADNAVLYKKPAR